MREPEDQVDVRAIRKLAETWARAVEAADLETLARLMVEDIVVVHGDGRCLTGRKAVLHDLTDAFKLVRIAQHVEHEETVVLGSSAFDRANVQTTVTRLGTGLAQEVESRTWTILRRQPGAGWAVARVIGVIKKTSAGT